MNDEFKDTPENLKETIKDTQMLIRNSMLHHKKVAKRLHGEIKKDKKTIDLYKEKIAKLTMEKEKLEAKLNNQNISSKDGKAESFPHIRNQINKEVAERMELEEKIKEIKEDFLIIKNQMGGLNATQQVQERYEKHIRILENRLDKANQKFNESIEYDKKLREEIDKLRKERFFFENIYKKLEKELEKLRKEISINLEAAYESYEKRDKNQETFENIKAQMMKKESEYAQILSSIANDINIRNSRKKSADIKDLAKNFRNDDNLESNFKSFSRKLKSEIYDIPTDNIEEKYQNLKYKLDKLKEFTGEDDPDQFCRKFKKNAQKNFDLFLAISMVSKQAKQTEKEIKDLEEEIDSIKRLKSGQVGVEKNTLLNELKSKTQKLIQKYDKYESETKKNMDDFKQIKNTIYNLFITLECNKEISDTNKIMIENGVSENNIRIFFSEIESKLKILMKFYENERMMMDDYDVNHARNRTGDKVIKNPKQVAEDMKNAFSNMGKYLLICLYRYNKNKNI